MSYIETFPVQHSTILRIYSEKDQIRLDPDYQRMGGVWTLEKKQLLIDSILNDYDIPKIYLHEYDRAEKKASGFQYAVIDGRQRLETIWQFIEGKFTLSDDIQYQADADVKIASLGYSDIASEYPKIKIKFDSFVLPIVGVGTDDVELIEDMFSRLNEAVPLNAAEKRNAFGGGMVKAIREISEHDFFLEKISFNNRRYQYMEVACRLLFVEECIGNEGRILDTKKVYLDAMVKNYKSGSAKKIKALSDSVTSVLDYMSSVFVDRDELLRAQGGVVLYYLCAKSALINAQTKRFSRKALMKFRDEVKSNREVAEDNYLDAKFDLLEFDRLSQQGTNDASNIKDRLSIICKTIGVTQLEI
ncbi:DUF262 domain-containing protein [Pseudomonas sp. B7]|uniref:DUF262 domain-containing protein n=1 Tax=Pseudomonas sp. B7 TaxID=360962 RepID=UPI00191F9765|nr:DUF262 domain-containing protein [Pseudomonas sp. B7]MBL0798317.1 DUF262 domain-containing protein [Pseudomonas sp. B7]